MWMDRDRDLDAEPKARKKRKAYSDVIECMPVYGDVVYFRHYIESRLGAPWWTVRDSLYDDFHYNVIEVDRYRNELISDFEDMCERHGLKGVI